MTPAALCGVVWILGVLLLSGGVGLLLGIAPAIICIGLFCLVTAVGVSRRVAVGKK